MLRPQLLALVASSASAFLVVPDVAPSSSSPSESEGAFKALPIEEVNPLAIPPTVQSQSVSVPCAECLGKDAKIHFDIEVVDTTRLLVNGFEVYPADEQPLKPLKAKVSSTEWSPGVEEALEWVVWWQVTDVDQKQGMRILDWHLGVGSVGSMDVNNVGLEMTLVVGPNNEVMIADVKTPKQSPPGVVVPACDSLLCRFEELWSELFDGSMGCHKQHKEMDISILPAVVEEEGEYFDQDDTESRSFGKMVLNVVSHIFLPVIMGILAGVGSAFLVMLVCSLFAMIGSKIAGRHDRHSWTLMPPRVVILAEEGTDEKDGLMDGQAPPPAYDEPVEKE